MANQDPGVVSPSVMEDRDPGGPVQPEPPNDAFALIARAFHRVLDPICRYLCYAAAIVTLLMAIGMVVDLVSRMVFRNPLSGMIELQTFMLVIMAFFSIAYTMLRNQHVSVDLITSVLSDYVNSVLQSIFSVWGVFIFGAMNWLSAARALEAFEREEVADITRSRFGSCMPWWPSGRCCWRWRCSLPCSPICRAFTDITGIKRRFGLSSGPSR